MVDNLINEISYRFSRSSGPGGQSVNKLSTQEELLFDVEESVELSEDQKLLILEILKNRITKEGILALKCSETRSRLKNKELVTKRFIKLIEDVLKPVRQRKPTTRSKSSIEKRLRNKKIISDKKRNRKNEEN